MGWWKKLKCKLCCGFQVSINDVDGDGVPDQLYIEPSKKEYTTNI